MCGRYALTAPAELQAALGGLLTDHMLPADLIPRFNIAPTQLAVIANRAERSIEMFRWGLVPRWAEDPSIGSRMINARSETASTKLAFREALQRRRCLVPADGFYEWRQAGKKRQPIWIRREPRTLVCFAGIWERWRRGDAEPVFTFSIPTTAASPKLADLHDRMPVILAIEDYARWLEPAPVPSETDVAP